MGHHQSSRGSLAARERIASAAVGAEEGAEHVAKKSLF